MRRLGLAAAAAAFLLLVGSPVLASNDDNFQLQWGLHKLQAEQSWATSTGKGVVVAVLDTGVEFGHPDIGGDKEAGNFDCTGGPCRPANVRPEHPHATMVSGIITAKTNNIDGNASVAPHTKVISYRVCRSNSCGGDITGAIRDAADRGAKVINMSLGFGLPVPAVNTAEFADAFAYANSRGVVVAASAGNQGDAALMSGYAAAPENVIVVGATGPNDEVASYSSGDQLAGTADVNVYAPGGNAPPGGGCTFNTCILTTDLDGGYSSVQGTSFAAPHVAGIAAQLACFGLSPSQIKQRIMNTADTTQEGKGRANAAKAAAGLGGDCAGSFPKVEDVYTGISGGTSGQGSSGQGGAGGGQAGQQGQQGQEAEQGGEQGEEEFEPLPTGTVEAAGEEDEGNPMVNIIIGGVLGAGLLGALGWSWLRSRSRAAEE